MHVLNKGLWHHWGWLTVTLGIAWSIPTLLVAWIGSPWLSSNHSTLCRRKTNYKRIVFPTNGANWYCTESVGWTLRLRWTTSGCGRPTKWTRNQKRDWSGPAKHPPMAKLVSQEWNSNFFGSQVSEKCTYLCFVQTGPLYRDLGMVICPVTSPRFTEANESGYNFLNGYKSCNR